MLSFPKDTAQFSWTRHIKNKMVFYHLSGAQILRIFRKPNRREEGIAPNTVAAMISKISKQQTVNSKQRHEEIWIMYKLAKPAVSSKWLMVNSRDQKRYAIRRSLPKSKITLISAWRYPGKTKPGEHPAIPADTLEELLKIT